MNYFKNTCDVLDKYTGYDYEEDDKSRLSCIHWELVWSLKDYELLDMYLGKDARDAFMQDLIEAERAIKTNFMDSYKKIGCTKSTVENKTKIQAVFTSLKIIKSIAVKKLVISPNLYRGNENKKEGLAHPMDWTDICEYLKTIVTEINDSINTMEIILTNVITDMMLEQIAA